MKTAFIFCFLFFQIYNTCGEDGYLPPYIKPCELNSKIDACIKEQIDEILPLFANGIKELGVASIDPVKLDDIHIDGNGLKLKFADAAMHGLSKVKVTELKVDLAKQDEEAFTLAFKGNLSLKANYTADGQILILPIRGDGDALIQTHNIEVNIAAKLMHTKDPKGEHFKLSSPSYKYDIERTTFDLKNLFNGNKQLADTTLQFANENWKQLMDDLAPPVVKQIVRTVVKTINKFFSKVPIKQIVKNYPERS